MECERNSINRRQALLCFAAFAATAAVAPHFAYAAEDSISVNDLLHAWPDGPKSSLNELVGEYISDPTFDRSSGEITIHFRKDDLRADAEKALRQLLARSREAQR